MGILYNRFTPEPSLLPYTNQNKIVTYATTENFDASSTTWGEGTAPLVKDSGGWATKNDGSITFSSTGVANPYPVSVHNMNAFGSAQTGYALTIYEVLYIEGYDPEATPLDLQYNTQIYRGNPAIGNINEKLFAPEYNSTHNYFYRSTCSGALLYTYCDLPTLNKLHITVAAYERKVLEPHTRFSASVFLRCNETTRSYNSSDDGYLHEEIQSIMFNGKNNGDRRYRFIAIVAEKESSAVIANNVAHLKNYFNVEY